MVDAPTRGRPRTRPPDLSRIRRFARMLMYRGERATEDGDFTEAAVQFERAAWGYEYLSEPLAGRIENLVRESAESLPEGGRLSMRVWAAILRRGDIEPVPLLHLIRMRRRARRAGAPRANEWPDPEAVS